MSCHAPTAWKEEQWELKLNNIRTFGFRYHKRNQHKLVEYTEKFTKQMLEFVPEPKGRNTIRLQEDGTRIRDQESYTDSRQYFLSHFCFSLRSVSFCSPLSVDQLSLLPKLHDLKYGLVILTPIVFFYIFVGETRLNQEMFMSSSKIGEKFP